MKKCFPRTLLSALVAVLALIAAAPAEETAAPAAESTPVAKAFAAADEYAAELLAGPPEGLTRGDVAMAFGWIYMNSVLGEPAFDKAAEYYGIARDEGVVDADTTLGALYMNAEIFGLGANDVDKALGHYEQAAAAGSADANLALGLIHYDGQNGMVMDPMKGGAYLVVAARHGNPVAIDYLTPRLGQAGFPATAGELVDEALAAETARREDHFVDATTRVIELLDKRLNERGIDVGKLEFDGMEAALAGMSPEERAAYWEKVDKATDEACAALLADQADSGKAGDAALVIGVLHHLGLLHGHTPEKARHYMEVALEHNVPEARVALGEYYLNMLGEEGEDYPDRDVAKGLEYLNAAADAGSVDALRLLGVLYTDGAEGVAADAEKAEKYLLAAAKHGDRQALEMLEPVFEKAREWEKANPGKQSPIPTGAEAVVDAELAKATDQRRGELEAVANLVNQEIERRTQAAFESEGE